MRGSGLPQKFLDGLDDLLRDAAALIPMEPPPVILTGEYIPENLLLDIATATAGRLGGVIDFGDVMTGWREYDLMGPSAFMAAGGRAGCAACSTVTAIHARTSISS